MSKRNHLRLLSEKQLKEVGKIKFNYGFPSEDENEEQVPEPNYYYMAKNLRNSLQRFNVEKNAKYEKRNPDIVIPASIDYIYLYFIDLFVIDKFYKEWFNQFGLEGVSFSNFGRSGLFAVTDRLKFEFFVKNISNFIDFGLDINKEVTFSEYIKYVLDFKLLTSKDIIRFKEDENGKVVYLSTIDLPLNFPIQKKLLNSLEMYISSKEITYNFNEADNRLELHSPDYNTLKEIAENFDIVQSITCSVSEVVGPSAFNLVTRNYGFTISNSDEELPIIGIIDTGISMDTPLSSITIKDESFSLADSPLIDYAGGNNRLGHGTSVAALASLGRINHLLNFEGVVKTDAKLLSIKISKTDKVNLSESDLIKMLYSVKEKYPEIKIFVLATCYSKFKAKNESYSTYTFELDKFSHETDSIICICTANNNNVINENSDYDLEYFNSPHTNLCTPSDSLNNITVGAAAENLNNDVFYGISPGREYPAMYTRKGHIDLKAVYPKTKTNKHFFKPDVIECGGDVGFYNSTTLDFMDHSSMTVLSARPEIGITCSTGTSLSAPLVANLAAKIMKAYPTLNTQTIKALIINGASLNNIIFPKSVSALKNSVAGHGFIDIENSLFSTDESPTLILEDSIGDEEMKIYPVNFPKYLVESVLGRNNGILKFSATLCFSFLPIQNNQLSYNPIHMAFCFFRNHSSAEINAKKDVVNSKLRVNLGWSQNGRDVSKPIPYSNTQKINFTIDVKHLIDEGCTLNLAIHAKLTKQIVGKLSDNYPNRFPFSLVIRVEENFKNEKGRLYEELMLINHLEVITEANLVADLES